MSTSILNSMKKVLNLAEDDTAFDMDVMMHVNSAISRLSQLGVGPADGFMIEDAEATWETFLGSDPRLNDIKSFVFLYVKLLFDPPATGFGTSAIEKQIEKYEWLINVRREDTEWTDPLAPVVVLIED